MTSYMELFALFVLLMLPFLYETSHTFRYYFKFLIYYGIVSFNSIILIPAFLFRPCDVRNLLWASTFSHRISDIIGLRWELRGREHLEKDQACIIVANHQSSLDVLGMFDMWHVMNKCTVVAKRELFYAWPFGLAAWLAGLIFIDRVRGENARKTLNAVNSKIKKQKIKLWIFPEGTRRNTGELHPFKKGAFHLAVGEQIPILPVVFSSYCTFLNDKKKILNSGHIIVCTLPPIATEGLTKDDIPELMERVHQQMSETFQATSAEILQSYIPCAKQPSALSTSSDDSSILPANVMTNPNETMPPTQDEGQKAVIENITATTTTIGATTTATAARTVTIDPMLNLEETITSLTTHSSELQKTLSSAISVEEFKSRELKPTRSALAIHK